MNVESDSDFMANYERKSVNTVKFYWREVPNKMKSLAAGHPVCDWKEYVIILCPGQTRSETNRPATDLDRREYRGEYEAFQRNGDAPLPGTPIHQLPGISPHRANELRKAHIFTVEQMAACPDTAMRDIGMDFNSLKNASAEFLKRGNAEVEGLRRQVAELTQKLNELTAPKKPGRPRKQPEIQVAA